MPKMDRFDTPATQTDAFGYGSSDWLSSEQERLFHAAYFESSPRDEAEFASNKMLSLMEKHNNAPVSLKDTGSSIEFTIKVGTDSSYANELVSTMDKNGYPLKLMFGPNQDRELEIKAFEDAKASAGMSKTEATGVLSRFLNHADRTQHSEDVLKSWDTVRCHPANDPVACPDGAVSSIFAGSYFEISGAPGELRQAEYSRLNSALKTLKRNGTPVRIRFE